MPKIKKKSIHQQRQEDRKRKRKKGLQVKEDDNRKEQNQQTTASTNKALDDVNKKRFLSSYKIPRKVNPDGDNSITTHLHASPLMKMDNISTKKTDNFQSAYKQHSENIRSKNKEGETETELLKRKSQEEKLPERLVKGTKQDDPDFRKRKAEFMKQRRKDPVFREKVANYKSSQKVKEKDKQRKQVNRINPEFKFKETLEKRKKRRVPEIQEMEREAKRKQRQNPCSVKKETEAKKKKHENPVVYKKEMEAKRKIREDPKVKEKEMKAKRKIREEPKVIEKEMKAKRTVRQDPKVKEKEMQAKRKRRLEPTVYEKELEAKRQKRESHIVKEKEIQAKRKKRQDPQARLKEAHKKSKTRAGKKPKAINELISFFHSAVEGGPLYICSCCTQLMFRHSVSLKATAFSKVSTNEDLQKLIDVCMQKVKSVDNKEWICTTCCSYIKKCKIPPAAIENGMQFPSQGPLKELNQLELRLLAPMLPFMHIHEAPRGRQLRIHGNMVVVPADIQNTVESLPRLRQDTATIKAKLKRRLRYKHHVYSANIRPEKIRRGAKFLSETGTLFKSLNIKFNTEWQGLDETDPDQNHEENNEGQADNIAEDINNSTNIEGQLEDGQDSDDEWNEIDNDERTSGATDTLLTAPDFIETSERDFIFNYAPAEHNIPVSIFTEKTAEEQSFPGLFCGQARMSNERRKVPVTYGEIVKSELRNSDRRCAANVENIFYKAKKQQMKYLIDQTNIAIRKIKTKGTVLTAKDVRKENAINLIHLDHGFKILKTLRGSPPYFQSIAKDLFAMIRQLGPATFFCTLSAAESQWFHLLRILGKLVDNKDYTDEELENLPWQERCRLIQSDPVTCTRHFDFSLQTFMNKFILSEFHPIGNVIDWFYRIEFQQRGSPHAHMMFWCSDTPDPEDTASLTSFIDRYISCHRPTDGSALSKLVNLQKHNHSFTCKKKGKKVCRFQFPKPPMRRTIILEPFVDNESDIKSKYKLIWETINEELHNMKDGENITYDMFLEKLNITEKDYILAVRSSIATKTIFLKRSPFEIRINNYNTACLQAWRANIDIQFVTDVYACALYIASYVTKSQRGMSELLRKACKEASAGNNGIREQVRHIGNKFLNAVEISAQEACYLTLQLPLKRASRSTIFINTSPPEDRVVLLKPQTELQSMNDDDQEIECKNLLSRYAERPNSMENITLVEFASYYEKQRNSFVSRKKSICKTTTDGLLPDSQRQEDEPTEDDIIENQQDVGKQPNTTSKTNEYRKRSRPKIIRYVRFNAEHDKENNCRELLMLYLPWRNEEKDLKRNCTSYEERFLAECDAIEEQRSKFEAFYRQTELAESFLSQQPDLTEEWDNIAPNTEDQNRQDIQRHDLNNGRPKDTEQYDIGQDVGLRVTNIAEETNTFNELPDEQYRQHMRLLTRHQMEFVYSLIHHLKTKDTPVYEFLSGGAGVGKSFVTKALYQMILKYYNRRAGEDFTKSRILLMAPTGKAAYHIHGNTIHSSLRIPANQQLTHKPLESSALNTLQTRLGDLKVVFIDEISMVGYKLLNCVYQRLSEIKSSREDFGGVSVIAVGDLFQLKPVMDSFVFQTPKSNYMPLASNMWQKHFTMTELTEIMRQRENKEFAEVLNRLREGNHTEDDILTLKARLVDPSDDDYPHEVAHLFLTNEKVNSYNTQVFLQSKAMKYTVKAKDRLTTSHSKEAEEKILQTFQSKTKETPQLPAILQLAEGLMYEITMNLDTDDGFINWATCKLMKIKLLGTELTQYAAGILWVQFLEENTGRSLRCHEKRLYDKSINKKWTPISPSKRDFQAGYKGEATVRRLQFPLRASAAKTVHRAQGDTVDEIVVDLSTNRKVDHTHYVALSRVTSLSGLHIRNLQDDKISVNSTVKDEMNRLRSETKVQSLRFLYNIKDKFKISFLNANSLNRHMKDVNSDFSIKSADIVAFCETRFVKEDSKESTSISNFFTYRQDSVASVGHLRPSYGLAVYSKQQLSELPVNCNSSNCSIETALLKLQHPIKDLVIVFLYKPPKVTVQLLIKHLSHIYHEFLCEKPSIIMGDFNINWQNNDSNKRQLREFIENKLQYRQLITGPTTDDSTSIDLIFTNLPYDSVTSGTLEAYYSPHKPIWIVI